MSVAAHQKKKKKNENTSEREAEEEEKQSTDFRETVVLFCCRLEGSTAKR